MMTQIQCLTRLRSQAVTSLILTLTLSLSLQAQETTTEPRTVILKRGRVLELTLLAPLDSREAEVGDQILFGLMHPLIADGATIFPAPWIVRTRVSYVARPRKKCDFGSAYWELQTVETADGQMIKVRPISPDTAKRNGEVVERITPAAHSNKPQRISKPKTAEWAWLPLGVAALPLWVVLVIGMQIEEIRERCPSIVIPAGYRLYLAVSEDTQVTVH